MIIYYSYNYSCDGVEELVRHTLNETETKTHNELFNREKTIYELPQFGYPNTKKWERYLGQTELFDETYIPTFIFYDYGNFFIKGTTSHTFSKVVAILKDNVFTFNVCIYIYIIEILKLLLLLLLFCLIHFLIYIYIILNNNFLYSVFHLLVKMVMKTNSNSKLLYLVMVFITELF